VVQYSTLAGESLRREFSGYQARVIQHELDHLQAVLLVDRMQPQERSAYQLRLERYVEQYGEGGAP
jgi:peptide deformylase